MEDYWDTPIAEIILTLEGEALKAKREHDERLYLGWVMAQLTAYAPAKAKDFISLDRLLGRNAKSKQSPEDRLKIAEMWAAVKRG